MVNGERKGIAMAEHGLFPRVRVLLFAALFLMAVISSAVFAQSDNTPALKNAVILIIRHAEKPETGYELSPAGQKRALAYVDYFRDFTVDSKPLRLNYLFAAADSKESHRPYLSIEPLSKALGLNIDTRFKDRQFLELARELQSRPHGQNILICWHHGKIPQLISALGGDPAKLIPAPKWPEDVFGWVIQLRYDENGQLLEAKRINEGLFPDDSSKDALEKP